MSLALLWLTNNWQTVAKGVGVAALVSLLYWAFIHNPKVMEQDRLEKIELKRQIQLRDNAIGMLGTIERTHDVITKQSGKNSEIIQTSPAPVASGVLVPVGVFDPTSLANIPAGGAATSDGRREVLPAQPLYCLTDQDRRAVLENLERYRAALERSRSTVIQYNEAVK